MKYIVTDAPLRTKRLMFLEEKAAQEYNALRYTDPKRACYALKRANFARRLLEGY